MPAESQPRTQVAGWHTPLSLKPGCRYQKYFREVYANITTLHVTSTYCEKCIILRTNL